MEKTKRSPNMGTAKSMLTNLECTIKRGVEAFKLASKGKASQKDKKRVNKA